jgi:lipopolysaccharide transport protein LptA
VLRIVLPLLLLGAALALYWSFVPPRTLHGGRAQPAVAPVPAATGIRFVEYRGQERAVIGDVARLEQSDDGALHLEGINDLEILREGRAPLVVTAARGSRTGPEGQRVWHFEERVVFREVDRGLELRLPYLDIDEEAGEARSSGDIRLAGPGVDGLATAVVYDLRGRPSTLATPEFVDVSGASLRASTATLRDGTRDIELVGEVVVIQRGERLDAARLQLWRGADDRLERVEADGGVWGSWPLGDGPPLHLRATELALELGGGAELRQAMLRGRAHVRRSDQSLGGERLEIVRVEDGGGGFRVDAAGSVVAETDFAGAAGLLRTDALRALLDPDFAPRSGEASGSVSFEGRETRADAERATFVATGRRGEGQLELFAGGHGKARLSHGRTRIAAATIKTDSAGAELLAETRVEASLLPDPAGPAAAGAALLAFSADDAIHFVAERLTAREQGTVLDFTGNVRGYQGERNLAAERLHLDQRTNALDAEDEVSTRFPRLAQAGGTTEDEFVQIRAARLTYQDALRKATYEGEVAVDLAEGSLTADRVEVELSPTTGDLAEVRAFDRVRLEFVRGQSGALDEPISGEADRAVYDPREASVLLIGDRAPATVERRGRGGGSTTGRRLAYRLDLGTLVVDSGEQSPASIRTSGGAPGGPPPETPPAKATDPPGRH